MDLRLALISGVDIPVPECQLVIHQPTLKEISYIGEEDYFMGAQVLTVSGNKILQEQDESLLDSISNFQIFMTIITREEAFDKKEAVNKILQLLFPKYKISFLPRSLLFSIEGQMITIDESNFEVLQEALKQVFCFNKNRMGEDSFNPQGDKAKEIAEKLMRARQRVAAQSKDGNGSESMLVQYISVLTVGLNSMSLEDCLNLTLFQLYDLIERYSLYINWDIDIRARLAGASAEKSPENWMKNIH